MNAYGVSHQAQRKSHAASRTNTHGRPTWVDSPWMDCVDLEDGQHGDFDHVTDLTAAVDPDVLVVRVVVADLRMAEIRVGTSGWNYPSGAGTWNGVFYPAQRPRGFDELAYYAEHFDTVEVNSTFYRMPEAAMTAAWVRRTPASFLFAVKLFQKFTHPDMYLARDGVRDWDLSRARLRSVSRRHRAARRRRPARRRPRAVSRRAFTPTPDTRAYLDWLLGGLAAYPLAVELRHRSWSDDAARHARSCSTTHRAAWVLIDEPKFESSIRQRGSTRRHRRAAPLAYVRLHGRNAAAWWDHAEAEDRYNYLYSAEELRAVRRSRARRPRREQARAHVLQQSLLGEGRRQRGRAETRSRAAAAGRLPERRWSTRYPELRDVVERRRRRLLVGSPSLVIVSRS